MQHLLSREHQDYIEAVYHLSLDEQSRFGNSYFTYQFTRIGVGVSFKETNYAVVVGERSLVGEKRVSRLFVVLDEVEGETPNDLISNLIYLKDKYLAHCIYGPKDPAAIVQSICRAEGLTFYPSVSDEVVRLRWPTFTSRDNKAYYSAQATPGKEAIQQELEFFLTEKLYDPNSNLELMPTRVVFPSELNNAKARTSVRQAYEPIVEAIWHVLHGLEHSRARASTKTSDRWTPNPVTGY